LVVLVTERHGLKRQNRFAESVHWLYLRFEPARGVEERAELASGVHPDLLGVRIYESVTNVSDIATVAGVSATGSNTNDITGRRDLIAGTRAQGDIAAAADIAAQR